MATVLFIGGVGPDVKMEDVAAAFSEHQINLLATSVVRHPISGKCIGQAYLTVRSEDVRAAMEVTAVGNNAVVVFPVEVEAWTAPAAPEGSSGALTPPAATQLGATAAATAAPTLLGGGGGGAAGYGTPVAAATAAGAAGPWMGMGMGGGVPGMPADASGLPTSPYPHLQTALDQLRQQLAVSPHLTFNGKTFVAVLHEVCQKNQLTVQVAEMPDRGGFGCSMSVVRAGGVVCSGRGTGTNKKDAKHSAAGICLDALLVMGEVEARDIIGAMTTTAAAAVPAAALAVAGADPGVVVSPAAASAMALTQAIVQQGLYPRCAEVMAQVYSTEVGRTKTILMVLNEYAVRVRLGVVHDDVSAPGGLFCFVTRLTDNQGGTVVAARGAEVKSKQEAKQASAAAMIENLLANNAASVDQLARGK